MLSFLTSQEGFTISKDRATNMNDIPKLSDFRYVGLWRGGATYAQGQWETDAELFHNLEHAKGVFYFRTSPVRVGGAYWSRMARPTYAAEWDCGQLKLGHKLPSLPAAAVVVSGELALYPVVGMSLSDTDNATPSHTLITGPRGGIRIARFY